MVMRATARACMKREKSVSDKDQAKRSLQKKVMMKGNHPNGPDLDRDRKIVNQMLVIMMLPNHQFNVSRKERIKAIDLEMKHKLIELRNLMSEEGMTESVSVLQNLFGVDQHDRNRGQGHHVGMNLNSNANHANVRAKHSITIEQNACSKVAMAKKSRPAMACSDETIYDPAVECRTSSSSEDADKQDTSGETVEIDFDKLNVGPVFPDGTVVS